MQLTFSMLKNAVRIKQSIEHDLSGSATENRNSTWSKNYPFLKCAAVADIDHNTLIQKADSDSLGKYIAEKGAGAVLTNKEINTLFPVTVVYEN